MNELNESVPFSDEQGWESVSCFEWFQFFFCVATFAAMAYLSFRFFRSSNYLLFGGFLLMAMMSPQYLSLIFEKLSGKKVQRVDALNIVPTQFMESVTTTLRKREKAEQKLSLMFTQSPDEIELGELYEVGSELVLVTLSDEKENQKLNFDWFKNPIPLYL